MRRKLSVQYAGEDTGLLYQFNDGGDACWHAGKHNKSSIGVEGCLYPLASKKPNYYSERRNARLRNLPHDVVEDIIHGRKMTVFAFTEPQVDALARLAAGNWVALNILRQNKGFPLLPGPPKFPVDKLGQIPRTTVKPEGRWMRKSGARKHVGLIGHLQCTRRKIDPAGFPWENFEELVFKYYQQFAENGGLV
jgi:N-acetyl-anhydromuramyl-L-alanine amidase AmpD